MGAIKDFPEFLFKQNQVFRTDVPEMQKVRQFIDHLIQFLFPIKANKSCTRPQIKLSYNQLQLDFKELLTPIENRLEKPIDDTIQEFFKVMPDIYAHLIEDAKSFVEFDPAAKSIEGVIIYYPGFHSISVYRFANVMYKLKIPFIPRMISEYAHGSTGIDLHPGATIGQNFLIDHGTGIVIGETAIIGKNVKIYQGVTLGALYVQKGMANTKRHPTIEDNVIIYSGSTILGGDTVVGHDTVVGGNVWLTKSVPPNSVVYHESKVVIRDSKDFREPINFVI